MANIIKTGGSSGAKKNYIFKDGEFKIQPTQSNMQIVNGTLTNGYYLDIPYNYVNEIVYFSLKTVSGYGECNMKVSTTIAPVTNGGGSFTDTAIRNITTAFEIIMALPSGTRISYCCNSNCKSIWVIKEIWTEKSGGGN